MAENAVEELFSGNADHYAAAPFTRNTEAEVDFILAAFALPPESAILDMGCGTGRHSVALARRGYRMTGVDIAAGMLAEARQAAARGGQSQALGADCDIDGGHAFAPCPMGETAGRSRRSRPTVSWASGPAPGPGRP